MIAIAFLFASVLCGCFKSRRQLEAEITQHYMMLARNLIYTAVTRGKRFVVIVGQRQALAIAVKSGGGRRRWTKLRTGLRIVNRRTKIKDA